MGINFPISNPRNTAMQVASFVNFSVKYLSHVSFNKRLRDDIGNITRIKAAT